MANSINAIVRAALDPLVEQRVFPDVAPPSTATPYITYQGAGGQSLNSLSNPIDLQNTRMQVNVWAATREDATRLMGSAIAVLAGAVSAISLGAPVSAYERDTKLYGSRQDFSIWFYP